MSGPFRTAIAGALAMIGAATAAWAQTATTPAERAVSAARTAVATDPARPDAHAQLALALGRRARETGDPVHYDRANEALARALTLEPDHFEALKIRAWVLLGRHEFAKALELAAALNKRAPDDVFVYALLTDAHVELGNYPEAEQAAQALLDFRPGAVIALTRAAHLRELFGDADGARELLQQAFHRTPPAETEDRAWILTQLAHLELASSQPERAAMLVEHALQLFPGYHYALAQLGRVRSMEGHHADAAEAYRRRYEAAPHPENLYELGVALQAAGRDAEAERAFTAFERQARAEAEGVDNANRELIFYYADHARRPADALRIARLESARRSNVATLDALAWALHASGDHAAARRAIDRALAVGIRDAEILFRAGAIAAKTGDPETARRHLRQSLDTSPRSPVAEAARRLLSSLNESTPR
jgi:tetratricopeptide (TPR) repeat protein